MNLIHIRKLQKKVFVKKLNFGSLGHRAMITYFPIDSTNQTYLNTRLVEIEKPPNGITTC